MRNEHRWADLKDPAARVIAPQAQTTHTNSDGGGASESVQAVELELMKEQLNSVETEAAALRKQIEGIAAALGVG